MADNTNMELDDDLFWNVKGGLSSPGLNGLSFSVGDKVRFRAVNADGNQEIRIGHVVEVATSDDGIGKKYTVDNCDHPVNEIDLRAV